MTVGKPMQPVAGSYYVACVNGKPQYDAGLYSNRPAAKRSVKHRALYASDVVTTRRVTLNLEDA